MISFLSELWQYMRRRKRYWILPVLVILLQLLQYLALDYY